MPPTQFLLVHDDRFAPEAERLARQFFLETAHLDRLGEKQLASAPHLIVDIDLKNLGTSQAFRRHSGKVAPAPRQWVFLVASGLDRHAWQVQATALGATRHVNRDVAGAELAPLFSVAGREAVSGASIEKLRREAGGQTILGAGKELAELFGGMAGKGNLAAAKVTSIGLEINRSVEAVGATDWLATVRQYHEGTFQHCLLVSGVVAGYVNHHKPDKADAARLTQAALLHDIGKAQVPLHVLDKPGKLSEAEFDAIKTHPAAGFDYLVKQAGMDRDVLDMVRHHHEALDGSGYPDHLRGAQVSALTRILTVCDIFAALVEARSYKPPKEPEDAILILVRMALEGKLDYAVVRDLAQVFDMHPPATLAEIERNLARLDEARRA